MIRPAAVLVASAVAVLLGGCCSDTRAPGGTPTSAVTGAAPSGAAPTGAATAGRSAGARAYVDAVGRADLDGLVAAFAPDGEVVDVGRRIRGTDAIRQWARTEVIGGVLRVDGVTPLDAATQRVRVHWAPSGSSGWAADYTFTTTGDRISVADLQYAR